MKLNDLKNLTEGGKALSKAGVGRISKSDIKPTIDLVAKTTKIPVSDLHALGSVGKVESSGDIDLAVDISKHQPEQIHAKMVKLVGEDNSVFNKGTKIGSYSVPIAGDAKKGLVQVDLMFVDNVDWAKFAYFSAGDKSKYKGKIRTILLSSVASSLNEKGKDVFKYDKNGDLLVRVGRGIELSKGLIRLMKMRPLKKGSTTEYLKSMKSVSLDDIKKAHPELEFSNDTAIIDNPKQVVELLFGKGVTPNDVETAEQVLKLINAKFDKKQRDLIFHIAKQRLADDPSLHLPKELK